MNVAIFDLDGTLVDTAPDIIDALNRTLSDLDLSPIDEATGRNFIGSGAKSLVASGLMKSSKIPATESCLEAAYARFITYYTEACAKRSALYPGVREGLDMLQDIGIAMGVCTNKPHALSLDVLDAFGLHKYFRAVVGGDVLPERKPAARHLLETAKRITPEFSHAIMIGDSPTDVAAAQNAAIPIVAVDYGYTTTPPANLGANVVISDMRDLPSMMLKFWKIA
tara:strand:+ start:7188 stop:7859 length:672 start_codon:yes stop_codon:yes gene_type:complete